MIQEFFKARSRAGPSTLMKQWNIVLQCRAQSSQVKVLTSVGLAAIGRDSFAHNLECSWLMMLEGTCVAHVMVVILLGIIRVS